ncbi:MAG: sigma-70 family RNA polymerase sigma factor [Clostridia bacterium]|nr:sigma-70 family RNA polymerase sigma factor [Clostridia bacterium]MBR6784428.1 sigma-70 family RNA polymerase sigma factor [Clostridia bacterium]
MASITQRNNIDTAEAELIKAARNGDERAFESLAKAYKRILEYHIRQIDPNPANYDDLLQEGLIGLLKAVRSYDGKSASFATFASSCIRNSIISGVRKYSSQTSKTIPVPETALAEETAPSAEEVHLDSVNAKLLYDMVYEALSPYERIVFEMYLSEVDYETIAFVTGKDVKSISNAVFRIRTKLRQIVKNAEGTAEQQD